jgi:hypothetical protein
LKNDGVFSVSGVYGMFALYALLTDEAPAISNETLARDLQQWFKNHTDFWIKTEKLPFGNRENLILRWPSWGIRVAYEEGEKVESDSVEIQKLLASAAPCDLSRFRRRVRVVFGDDDGREHTNETIHMMDFLQRIPGAVVFDPQQNEIAKSGE